MSVISTFPSHYSLIAKHVAEVTIWGALSKDEEDQDIPEDIDIEYRNTDFFVALRNGDVYSFLACTPDFIKEYMEREGTKSFLSPGLVIIREMSVEAILEAVEDWLLLGLEGLLGLGHYGCLQEPVSSD